MCKYLMGDPEITANLYCNCVCIWKVAWFVVYICGNLWTTQYIFKNNVIKYIWRFNLHFDHTVCPGSSDPQKKYLIYLHQKMKFTPFFNY